MPPPTINSNISLLEFRNTLFGLTQYEHRTSRRVCEMTTLEYSSRFVFTALRAPSFVVSAQLERNGSEHNLTERQHTQTPTVA